MTVLHSEPSSGVGTATNTLCLTFRDQTPNKPSTSSATLASVSTKLTSFTIQPITPIVDAQNIHDPSQLEELDLQAELRADGEQPFPIDRRLLKEVVYERLGLRVARVSFLSAGTFHKAFLLHFDTKHSGHGAKMPNTLVFRIARRTMHMPKLKTESEVATLAYLRTRTKVPVPTVYWYDSNPNNSLGGEWMIMSKAKGKPLSRFYHTLPQETLRTLLSNLAELLIPVFEHRFPAIGSLYFDEEPRPAGAGPPIGITPLVATFGPISTLQIVPGPIISYPFFGSSRGLLSHLTKPAEIDRGPWATYQEYLDACVQREINGVVREGQGQAVGRRPRVAPMSEEGSNNSGSEDEDEDDWGVDWKGADKSRTSSFTSEYSDTGTDSSGTNDHADYYRDYRATQRSTFLVAHTARREASVREEMGVFLEVMTALREEAEGGLGLGEVGTRSKKSKRRGEDDASGEEQFTLDFHDLSLENVFVDEHDHSKITCIIDWESTCIRPLFQAAHLPTFLQPHHGHGHHHGHHRSHVQTPHRPHMSRQHSSRVQPMSRQHSIPHVPHTPVPRYVPSRSIPAQIFREEVLKCGGHAASQWLHLEKTGAKRRWAHRVVEWDGWEEGLAAEILGELEYGWEVEVSGVVSGVVDERKMRGERKAERDVGADGGRELGRRLEQWVKDGAYVASYHDEG